MAVSSRKSEAQFEPFNLGQTDEAAAEAAVRRFLFTYDFAAPDSEPKRPSDNEIDDQIEDIEHEPPPPPPLFTEADLEATREEARVLGHAQGLKDAEESALHFQVLAMESIADQLVGIRKAQNEANAQTHRMAAALAMTIVRKLLPTMAQDHGVAEVESLVTACVPHILNEPRLIIRVSEETAEGIRDRIEPLARDRGFEGSVVVMPDPGIGPADCRLEWDNGGAERDTATLFQKIQDIVDRNSDRSAVSDTPDAVVMTDPTTEPG